jgi:hypothetical protein
MCVAGFICYSGVPFAPKCFHCTRQCTKERNNILHKHVFASTHPSTFPDIAFLYVRYIAHVMGLRARNDDLYVQRYSWGAFEIYVVRARAKLSISACFVQVINGSMFIHFGTPPEGVRVHGVFTPCLRAWGGRVHGVFTRSGPIIIYVFSFSDPP